MKCKSCYHIETSKLICSANQLAGFYMMATTAFNDLIIAKIHGHGINYDSLRQRRSYLSTLNQRIKLPYLGLSSLSSF